DLAAKTQGGSLHRLSWFQPKACAVAEEKKFHGPSDPLHLPDCLGVGEEEDSPYGRDARSSPRPFSLRKKVFFIDYSSSRIRGAPSCRANPAIAKETSVDTGPIPGQPRDRDRPQ